VGLFDWFFSLFRRGASEDSMVAQVERMLTTKVDRVNQARVAMSGRLSQMEHRMQDLDSLLRRADVQGIRRRQSEEDFERVTHAIALSRKEAKLLDQQLSDAEETRAKARELMAGQTDADEARVLIELKAAMETLDQRWQLTTMALTELKATDIGAAAVEVEPTQPDVVAHPEAMTTPPSPLQDESDKAADRKRRMDELMGPMDT